MSSFKFKISTPQKKYRQEIAQRSGSRIANTKQDYGTGVNYKIKTYQLMKQITQMQIKEKQYNRTLFYLQRQQQIAHRDLQGFLEFLEVGSLVQAKQLISEMSQSLKAHQQQSMLEGGGINSGKIQQQYGSLIAQYKQIIKDQENKVLKYQAKCKARDQKLQKQNEQLQRSNLELESEIKEIGRKYKDVQSELLMSKQQVQQRLSSQAIQNAKLEQRIKQQLNTQKELTLSLQNENKQQRDDLQMIKVEFRQLLIEKQTLEDKYQKLKSKYKQQIDHFQIIEKQVEEKLIEVEKQISFYKQEREAHIDKIRRLKEQIRVRDQTEQERREFSFGGYAHTETQTELQDDKNNGNLPELNVQCYEISIKSLLQQNNRLKRALVMLNKRQEGQEIPPQAELQLKLLKGISGFDSQKGQSNSKIQKKYETQKKQSQEQYSPEQTNDQFKNQN